MGDTIYDLCIVGAGMFGSAAARYASANPGIKVCLVGPDEPTPEEKRTREIFGAHYDEGRITSVLDEDIPTQILSKHSISRYRELEELSGIDFYHPVGLLYVSTKNSPHMKHVLQVANISKLSTVDMSYGDVFNRRYHFLNLQEDDHPILDDTGAGHISPRNMVAAQKKVAEIQGCHIIHEVVFEVTPLINGFHEIITEKGTILKARRVLICTGAFTNFKKFPIPKLKIKLNKDTMAFIKIPLAEAKRLSYMPCIFCHQPENELGAYILPPIQYPNGHYYLKVGHIDFGTKDHVESLDEIKEWYNSKGDHHKIEKLLHFLKNMLPGLVYEEMSGMTCVTCENPSGQPYIDRATPTVTVAVVGNGKGAKLSDEVGRIAAQLSLTGKWESELSQSHFKIIAREE